MRLAQKEEQLLEKELVHEQINRLVNKVKSKTQNGREDTLTLAKSVRRNYPKSFCKINIAIKFSISGNLAPVKLPSKVFCRRHNYFGSHQTRDFPE